MRRNAAIFGLALLCLALVPGAAMAAPGNGKGPKQDLVAGTGITGSYVLHVNAQSGPSGEDPRGKVRLEYPQDPADPFFNFNADVTCMDVVGKDSVVAGITDFGMTFVIWVSDNGQGNGTPDAFFPFFFFAGGAPPPGTCSASAGLVPTDRGNFTVHDSSP
jgi:hypothetical protein